MCWLGSTPQFLKEWILWPIGKKKNGSMSEINWSIIFEVDKEQVWSKTDRQPDKKQWPKLTQNDETCHPCPHHKKWTQNMQIDVRFSSGLMMFHSLCKSQKKSHSTLWAQRVDKSSKMVNFSDFLKPWKKCQNWNISKATFWVIFNQCDDVLVALITRPK